MKNIYISTFHNADNYGAVLQCYALYAFLKKNSYNALVINHVNHQILKGYRIFNTSGIKSLLKSILYLKKSIVRKINFRRFRNNINIDNNIKDINYCFKDDDIIITGSDQVWNPKITGGFDDTYFLINSNDNIKKISYAASCGDLKYIEQYSDIFISLIRNLDYISVREKSLQSYLDTRIDKNVELVLDPTLLLNQSEWMHFIYEKPIINEKYIFVYTVGNENSLFINSVNDLSKKTGYKIVYFDQSDLKNKYKCVKDNWYKAGPMEFLNLLYYSEFVITTSFHALSFSIIFNKSFGVVLSDKIDRLVSLLSLVKLENRVINNTNDILTLYNKKIDWNEVNLILDDSRKTSQNWLLGAINNKRGK